jgi:hypothetical protein
MDREEGAGSVLLSGSHRVIEQLVVFLLQPPGPVSESNFDDLKIIMKLFQHWNFF